MRIPRALAAALTLAAATHALFANTNSPPPAPASVTLDPQGGAFPAAQPVPLMLPVTPGTPYGELPLPTRAGHTFVGWWTLPDGTGALATPSVTVPAGTTRHTLFAKWTPRAAATAAAASEDFVTHLDIAILSRGQTGPGWSLQPNGQLCLDDDARDFIVTGIAPGAAPAVTSIRVTNVGSLMLDELWLRGDGVLDANSALVADQFDLVVQIKNRVVLSGTPAGIHNIKGSGTFAIETGAGAMLSVTGADAGLMSNVQSGVPSIVLRGEGTMEFDSTGGPGIMACRLYVEDNAVVVAAGGSPVGTGTTAADGVLLYGGALLLRHQARLTAIGGDAPEGLGGNGLRITADAVIAVSPTIAGALTAIGGSGSSVSLYYGNGISVPMGNLLFTGPGSMKAFGENGIVSWGNIGVSTFTGSSISLGASISAEGKGGGYGVFANGAGAAGGGVVNIGAGTLTAINNDTPGHAVYGRVNQNGGTFNEGHATPILTVIDGLGTGSYPAGATVTITANPPPADGAVFDHWTTSAGGDFADPLSATTTFTMPGTDTTVSAIYRNKPSSAPSGGGGGGGAPALPALALLAALLTLRATRHRHSH
jgi:uncharacterized repeat protein (TIGR02543 family)